MVFETAKFFRRRPQLFLWSLNLLSFYCAVYWDALTYCRALSLTARTYPPWSWIVLGCPALSCSHGRNVNFKDTNPLMSSSLVILFGVKKFWRFWIWSETTECKILAEYGLQLNSTPPLTHTVCIYSTFSLGSGGGGAEVREKKEGQQCTSIVPSSMGSTVHKLGQKYQPWVNVSPVYKIC